jgi:transcriptional regulator with PAS, ATPase and Fis domain
MPPLRERREDIPLLVEYFVDHCARRVGKNIQDITKESLDLLCSYPWPANIRELQNVIERSVIMCKTENFPIDKTWLAQQPPATEPKIPLDLSEEVIGKNSFRTFAETLSRRSCSESVQ